MSYRHSKPSQPAGNNPAGRTRSKTRLNNVNSGETEVDCAKLPTQQPNLGQPEPRSMAAKSSSNLPATTSKSTASDISGAPFPTTRSDLIARSPAASALPSRVGADLGASPEQYFDPLRRDQRPAPFNVSSATSVIGYVDAPRIPSSTTVLEKPRSRPASGSERFESRPRSPTDLDRERADLVTLQEQKRNLMKEIEEDQYKARRQRDEFLNQAEEEYRRLEESTTGTPRKGIVIFAEGGRNASI